MPNGSITWEWPTRLRKKMSQMCYYWHYWSLCSRNAQVWKKNMSTEKEGHGDQRTSRRASCTPLQGWSLSPDHLVMASRRSPPPPPRPVPLVPVSWPAHHYSSINPSLPPREGLSLAPFTRGRARNAGWAGDRGWAERRTCLCPWALLRTLLQEGCGTLTTAPSATAENKGFWQSSAAEIAQ